MSRLLDRLRRAFFRPLAFFTKEFIQMRRQPRLILMLIVGPFLVLLLFGLGYSSKTAPVDTVLVIPPDAHLPADRSYYAQQFTPPFRLVDVTDNRDQAVAALQAQKVDAVIIFPEHASETIRSGQHATVQLLYNELDPLQRSWLEYYDYVQTSEFNRKVLLQMLQQPQSGGIATVAGLRLVAQDAQIPPDVLVAPFRPDARNVAPTSPDFVEYYAPGVLALLVQHIAVTVTALALVRERLRGAVELFRVSPVSAREILVGKYASYFVQTSLFTMALVALMVYGLKVPFLGTPAYLAGALALLIAASLGLGFLISSISRTETQAVQFSMLVLLASVFFSGFFLPLHNLLEPVWAVSYALPVTYGIRALQTLMLRGSPPVPWVLAALGGMAVVFVLISSGVFQRAFRRR